MQDQWKGEQGRQNMRNYMSEWKICRYLKNLPKYHLIINTVYYVAKEKIWLKAQGLENSKIDLLRFRTKKMRF